MPRLFAAYGVRWATGSRNRRLCQRRAISFPPIAANPAPACLAIAERELDLRRIVHQYGALYRAKPRTQPPSESKRAIGRMPPSVCEERDACFVGGCVQQSLLVCRLWRATSSQELGDLDQFSADVYTSLVLVHWNCHAVSAMPFTRPEREETHRQSGKQTPTRRRRTSETQQPRQQFLMRGAARAQSELIFFFFFFFFRQSQK